MFIKSYVYNDFVSLTNFWNFLTTFSLLKYLFMIFLLLQIYHAAPSST